MAKDVLITPAGGKIEFSDGTLKGKIYELNGDLYVLSTSNTLILGDGAAANIEVGTTGNPITWNFLGGGDITSSGEFLNIGLAGDIINLNVSGVTYNFPNTITSSILGNAASATILQTSRTINGVSFNGASNIVVEPYIEDDESTNASKYLVFTDTSTAGYKRLKEDSGLSYNPSTGILSTVGINLSSLTSGYVPYEGTSGLADSGIYWDTSNSRVGISDTSPVRKLDINIGSTAVDGIGITTSIATNDPEITISRNNHGADIFRWRIRGTPGASTYLSLWDESKGNIDAGIILRGNNVGLNNTAPVDKLDIIATKNAGSWRPGISIADNSGFAVGVGGGIAFAGKYNTAGAYAVSGMIDSVKLNATDGDYSFDMRFMTRANGELPTEKIRITGSGNLGIATSEPDQALTIKGVFASTPSGNIRLVKSGTATTGGGAYIQFDTSTAATARTAYNSRIEVRRTSASDGSGDFGFFTTHVATSVNAQERLTITSDGKVGINSTTPKTNLQVNESALVSLPTLGTATGGLAITEPNGLYGLWIGVASSGNTWLQSQRSDANTTTYNLLLQPNGGSVTIGTDSSGVYKLKVNGDSNITGTLSLTNGSNTAIYAVDGNGNTFVDKNFYSTAAISAYGIGGSGGSGSFANIYQWSQLPSATVNATDSDNAANAYTSQQFYNLLYGGTSGYVLVSGGSGNTSVWTNTSTITAGFASQLQTPREIGDVAFNGTSNIIPQRIMYKDTRSTNFNPNSYLGITLHLKGNTTDSLADGGTYHGILNLAHWVDLSGGQNHQLAFTDNNNLWIRQSTSTSTWGSWLCFYNTTHADTANTASKLVLRDSSGKFSAGEVTLTQLRLTGSNTPLITAGGYDSIHFESNTDGAAGSFVFKGGTSGTTYATITAGGITATTFTGALSGNATTATTATSVVKTVTGTNSAELVRGNMADNDQFRILVGGTGANAGYAEIATADDSTEPIYIRQYSGTFTTLTRTLTLLDGSGNTSIPGNLSVTGTLSASGYNKGDWDTAYTDRNKWDGGSTGLTAATGRTSLGATTVGSNLFTLTNPSAITFIRVNADNTVSTLDAATFRTSIGAQASGNYQPLDADLTAIAGLTGTSGLLKKTAADTWTLDTNTYALNNQTMYIGTTSVTINRGTGALVLTGITSIDGSAGSVANAITFNTTGGAAAGTTYNGSVARTISYVTVGAASASHSHTALDIATGVFDIARIPTGTTGTTVALGNHTHLYAGSASAGGPATTALTLNTTRTIWGQNFNGGANVTGALSGATTGVFSSTIQATTGLFTNLSDGYIPYHVSDALGLANSAIYQTSSNIIIGGTSFANGHTAAKLNVLGDMWIGDYNSPKIVYLEGALRFKNLDGTVSGITENHLDSNNGGVTLQYSAASTLINGLVLNYQGRVGIATSAPSYPLHVNANVSGISIYATHDIAGYSDIRLKTDLEVIENAIDKINQISGYTFKWKDNSVKLRRAGVIAQEVEKILPEVISTNSDGIKGVSYGNMVALLIQGIKEQQIEINKLKEQLNNLIK